MNKHALSLAQAKSKSKANLSMTQAQLQAQIKMIRQHVGLTQKDYSRDNNKYLLEIVKEQLGISEDDITNLSLAKLKSKIRSNKIDKIRK